MQQSDVEFRGLFDGPWYAARHCPGGDYASAWEHFTSIGLRRGFDPNPLFRSDWYVRTYPEAAEAGALAHFVSAGAAKGHWASPLFESDWYVRTYPDVASAGLNALAHYVRFGRHEARMPASWCTRHGQAADLALWPDLRLEDLIGYLPDYSTLARLFEATDPAVFFQGFNGWIISPIENDDDGDGVRVIGQAGVIGGRRDVLTMGTGLGSGSGTRLAMHRAFRVDYRMSPVVRNAVHLLGRDFTTRRAIDSACGDVAMSMRHQGADARPTLLIDATTSADARAVLAERCGPQADAVTLAPATLCRVEQMLSIPQRDDGRVGSRLGGYRDITQWLRRRFRRTAN